MTEKSKTQQALDYLEKHPKSTVYEAAKMIDISASVIYRARAARNRPRCPSCGQYLPK